MQGRIILWCVEWEKAGSRVDIRVLSRGKREATNLQLRELQSYGHPLVARSSHSSHGERGPLHAMVRSQ